MDYTQLFTTIFKQRQTFL